jgi:hypothetical protein
MRIVRLLSVAGSIFGFAGLAQAVPLQFNFSGAVTNTAWSAGGWSDAANEMGKQVSGGFTFETDALASNFYPAPVPQQSFLEYASSGTALRSSAHLTLGGQEIEVLPYSTNYASISFIDACNPAPGSCNNSWIENFNLYANSSSHPFAADFTGSYQTRSLSFSSMIPYDPWDLDAPRLNYFDVSQGIDSFAIATLPLYTLSAIYSENIASCVAGDCSWTQARQWHISIDSVSRGVHEVPEPGTMALFGFGLAATLGMRRRKRASAIR